MNELVSIIMPSYKRHREIVSRAIDSLINQTYENIEIILVDDNAGIELSEYRNELENLACKYSNIVYIQNDENQGSAKSRNIGIKVAKGNYITFLDDDDLYLSEKIEKQLQYMLHNELDMCFTNQILINQNKKIVDFREYRRLKNEEYKQILTYHLTRKITGTNTFMMKKSVLEQVGGFDEIDIGDEFYLMYKIIETQCKIGYFDDSNVIAYRAGQDSLTLNQNRLLYEKKLYNFIKSKFDKLTFYQRMYVRFRYNVVKLITFKRAKMFVKMLLAVISAFFCAPISFFIEPLRLRNNIKKVKINYKENCDKKYLNEDINNQS